MTKILLTGSSGFVGSNLFDALHQDFELFGLDITKNGKLPENRVYGLPFTVIELKEQIKKILEGK
jgi:nucleoside-diphosphate-sugar epimerase